MCVCVCVGGGYIKLAAVTLLESLVKLIDSYWVLKFFSFFGNLILTFFWSVSFKGWSLSDLWAGGLG